MAEEEEELEPSAPTTSTEDLEVGLFNLIITLTMAYQATGMELGRARAMVASRLERHANALRVTPRQVTNERNTQ